MSIVDNSTSGGTCAALADYAFSLDGVLFGAGYDENLKVRHFAVERNNADRVSEMLGSKYVQSDLNDSFSSVKSYLDNGRFVCFVGTPCQIAGLNSFLRKDYINLLTVDLICHGVSSPLVFGEYVSYMEHKYSSDIKDIRFRNKTYGYHSGTMRIDFDNGKHYYGSGRIDYMLKSYFAGACSRYSCYECPFKGVDRCSDLSVFDSWHIEKLVPGLTDDDRGYTNVFIHTAKGLDAVKAMKDSLDIWPSDYNLMHKLDGAMIIDNPKMAICRKELIKAIKEQGFSSAMQNYLPVTAKDHILERLKSFAYKTGALELLKKFK